MSDDFRLVTTEFRVSHPHVFKPSKMPGEVDGKEMYSIEMLFDKATTKMSEIQKQAIAAAKDKWGPDKAKWPEGLKWPWRDGDKPKRNNKTKEVEVRAEHKGMWVVKASSKAEFSKPHVVGRDPKVALENESDLYPGCYARAYLKAFAWEFADKSGVKFILDGVQFIRDGKAIGGKKPADQMFDMIEGDDGELNDEENFDAAGGDEAEDDMTV